MTPLPEIEVLRKDLEKEVSGKRFKDAVMESTAMLSRQRNRPDFVRALKDQKIDTVDRRGTSLLLNLDNDTTLVVRLARGARLTRETANAEIGTDVQFHAAFTTGGSLHLHDAAELSQLFVLPTADLQGLPELTPGGIDPLADTFTWPAFATELKSRRTGLKKLFVDESFIQGLSDVYSDEILWSAGLAATRVSNTLTSQEVRRLYRAIFEVLYEAVKQGGTSSEAVDGAHTDLFGEEGDYADQIKVHHRAGQPCSRCRRLIERTRIDTDLYSFHCPSCQT